MLKRKLASDDATRARKAARSDHHDLSRYINKQRCLVLSSRGVSHRARHLLADIRSMIAPHGKADVKLDTKDELHIINEVCDLKNCSSALYLEAKGGSRRQSGADLYLYAASTPSGPTAKFEVQNIHTMAETKLTGNCLKGSRAVIVFDAAFDSAPHLKVMKALLHQTFNVPKAHPKCKPFIDHVILFAFADERIWVRHYQIIVQDNEDSSSTDKSSTEKSIKASTVDPQLIEIGPRFTLSPIKVIEGAFQGSLLWQSAEYTSPSIVRSQLKAQLGSSYQARVEAKQRTEQHREAAIVPTHAVDSVYEPDQPSEDSDDANISNQQQQTTTVEDRSESDEAAMADSAAAGLSMIDEMESDDESDDQSD